VMAALIGTVSSATARNHAETCRGARRSAVAPGRRRSRPARQRNVWRRVAVRPKVFPFADERHETRRARRIGK